MKTIKELYEHTDVLGHELKVGDLIQFQSSGMNLYGQIESIEGEPEKQKYVIKTFGWFGEEGLRQRVKEKYTINVSSKNIYQINLTKKITVEE